MRIDDVFVLFNPDIKFECKYSDVLSTEEYYSYIIRDPKKIEADFQQLLEDFKKESKANQNEIITYQKYVEYDKYLYTRYWSICRNKKLLESNFQCQLFIEHPNGKLNVHHNTYDHRGNEAFHFDCLIVVCRECHEVIEDYEEIRKENGYYNNESFDYSEPNKLELFENKINMFLGKITDNPEIISITPIIKPIERKKMKKVKTAANKLKKEKIKKQNNSIIFYSKMYEGLKRVNELLS
jgi:hypothetical protein